MTHKQHPKQPTDGELLLSRFLDGELNTDEQSQFQDWLRADDANINLYVKRAIDHYRLAEVSRPDPLDAVSEMHDDAYTLSIMTELVDDLLASRRKSEVEAKAQSLLLADLKAQKKESFFERRRAELQRIADDRPKMVYVIPRALPWLGLAAVIALMVAGLATFLPDKSPDDHAGSSDPPIRHNAPPAVAPVLVANVNASLDAQWGNGQAVMPGQSIYEGQTRTLTQGIVSLTLTNGVTLTLEAPATFETISNELVALSSGKMVGLVPDGAEGFTVRAPGMIIEDLGTEFAIEADHETGSHVEVLDGSVRLHPPSNTTADAGFAVEEIVVGEARQADATGGTLVWVDAEPTAFYREVPSPYERIIRDAGPLVYWRFNERNDAGALIGLGALGGAIPGVAESAMHLNNTPSVCEASDRALFLSQDRGLLPEGVSEGLNLTEDFTIEAWIFVPSGSDRRMRILANNDRAPDGGLSGGFGFGVSGGPEDAAGGPVLMFTGYTAFDAFSHTLVPTGRWVHVAVSLSGRGDLAMHIDGELVAHRINHRPESSGRTVVHPSVGPTRIGDALMTVPGPSQEYWVGGIDELAVYGRVLSQEEIANHATFDPENVIDRDSRNSPASGNRR